MSSELGNDAKALGDGSEINHINARRQHEMVDEELVPLSSKSEGSRL